MQTLIRRRILIWDCTVCQCPKCPSPGLTSNPLSTALWHHSDTNSAAINNRYLDFVQASGWISLVNDNHVDTYLKEIFAFVYYRSIVNNRSKNGDNIGTGPYAICKLRRSRPTYTIPIVLSKIKVKIPKKCHCHVAKPPSRGTKTEREMRNKFWQNKPIT